MAVDTNAELCNLAGAAAHAGGDWTRAESLWRQAAQQAGADAAAPLANLGVLLAAQGRREEAETAYFESLALDTDNPTTWTNLGVLLAAMQRQDEAEACHRRALSLSPSQAGVHTNLGLLLQAEGRLDEAEACQRQALELAPESAATHSNFAHLRLAQGHAVEAEAHLRLAIVLEPQLAAHTLNLGVLYADQRRDVEAEAAFRAALNLRPGYPLAELNLSRLLLAQGHWAEAWPLHEARHHSELPDHGIPSPDLPLPEWRGEPLAGRSLLIWPEQGFGDQIQFCRYVPWLKQQGAARVTLVCQRSLVALFETLPGVDAVVPADVVDNAFHTGAADLGGHDFWAFPLSLPRHALTEVADLPAAPIPYLRAASERVAAWSARWEELDDQHTTSKPLRTGLVWRGNPRHDNDADRSLPGWRSLTPLLALPGVRAVSLQPNATAELAGALPDWGAALGDFADTAAAVETLDLLICIDTSIAHLAGAMGKPCWVLLPHHRPDWRWLRERDESPWYPLGMRLFRQTARGDWDAVIEQVRAALGQRVALEQGA